MHTTQGSSVHREVAGLHKVPAVQGMVIVMVVQGILRGMATVLVPGMAIVLVPSMATVEPVQGTVTAVAVPDKETVGPEKANLKVQSVLAAVAAVGAYRPGGTTRVVTPVVAEGAWNRHQREEGCCRADIVEQVSRCTVDSPVDGRGPTWWFGAGGETEGNRGVTRGKNQKDKDKKKQEERKKDQGYKRRLTDPWFGGGDPG